MRREAERHVQVFDTRDRVTRSGRFLRDERGATAIEYALIASGVSIVIVGTVATLGYDVEELLHQRRHGAEVTRLRHSSRAARSGESWNP